MPPQLPNQSNPNVLPAINTPSQPASVQNVPAQSVDVAAIKLDVANRPQHMSAELATLLSVGNKLELQKYYQKLIEGNSARFDRYAMGRRRPDFVFTDNPKISTAAFAHAQGGRPPQVLIGMDFFIKNKLTEPQILWVMYHELGHFMDCAEGIATMSVMGGVNIYDARFEFEIQKGIQMAAKYKVAYNRKVAEYNAQLATNPDQVDVNGNKLKPKIELTPAQEQKVAEALGKIYTEVYANSIDDIHVNNRVAGTAEYSHNTKAHPDSMQSEVRRLYKEVLFKRKSNQGKDADQVLDGEFRSQYDLHDRDFIMPGYMQFTNDLLLSYGVNAAHNNVLTSHDAIEALAKSYKIKYKDINGGERSVDIGTERLVNVMLDPNSPHILNYDASARTHRLLAPNGKNTTLAYRSGYLDQTLLATFDELLWEDIKDKSPEDIISDAEQVIVMAGKASPDQIMPDDVIEAWGQWTNSAEANGGGQSGGMNIGDITNNFANKNNIISDTAERVAAAWRDVDPYLAELNELWKMIIAGTSQETSTRYGEPQRRGNKLDIKAAIKNWHKVISGQYDELNIYRRQEQIYGPSNRPGRIEFSLLTDQSGSMGDAYSEKNKVLERVATMLLMSLDNFNEWLLSVRDRSRSTLHVDAEVIAFGDKAEHIAEFRYGHNGLDGVRQDQYSGEKGKVNYDVIGSIGNYPHGRNTYDDMALDKVIASMNGDGTVGDASDRDKIEKIAQGKIMKIVFVITDGGSSNAASMKKKIEILRQSGVMVFAFQIGQVTKDEEKTFDAVWNESADGVKRGYKVGTEFYNLPAIISEMLAGILGEVKIYE